MTTSIRRRGDVVILDVNGRVTLGEATGQLRGAVVDALDQSQKLILNLAGVDYMDSAGLGEMIGAYTAAKNRGGEVKLLHPQKKLTSLLQLTRLYTLFETFEDEELAVASFGRTVQGAGRT